MVGAELGLAGILDSTQRRFFPRTRFIVRETLIFGGIGFLGTMLLFPSDSWIVWSVTAISWFAAGYAWSRVMWSLFGEPLMQGTKKAPD
jgi:hypothetical protein